MKVTFSEREIDSMIEFALQERNSELTGLMVDFALRRGGGPIKISNEMSLKKAMPGAYGVELQYETFTDKEQQRHQDQEQDRSGPLTKVEIQERKCRNCDQWFTPNSGPQVYCKNEACVQERLEQRNRKARERRVLHKPTAVKSDEHLVY